MKKLIVYDLDGTLVDTREDITRSVNHMLVQMQAPALDPREIRKYVGRGLHELVGRSLKTGDEKRIEKGAKIYRRHYAAHMLDFSRLYPGAREVLDYFRRRKQAVITNKPDPFSREILEALGIADYFVETVAGNSDYPKKPNPEALLSLMKSEKAGPGQTLFVGDSLIDIETGRNAGVQTVVLTHGFTDENELKSGSPDAIVTSFAEFLKLVRRKRW